MKKIIISLFAINVAVLSFVFLLTPKEVKAAPNYWYSITTPCDLYPPGYYFHECHPGTIYPTCVNAECMQFLPEVIVVK